jgi:regulator of sigma E protease
LKDKDRITKLTYKIRISEKEVKDKPIDLKNDQWGGTFFSMQTFDEREPLFDRFIDPLLGEMFEGIMPANTRQVTLDLERKDDAGSPVKVNLLLEPDFQWPMTERGFFLIRDMRSQNADGNVLRAIQMGLEDTKNTVTDVYFVIRGLFTGRLALSKTLGGPLTIGVVAYRSAGMGIWELVYFMALISANLAVINFLPIPFLDGGHMMFLIYEKVRGKPVPESVQAPMTYVGLLLLLLLMGTVIVLDVGRLWFW